MKTARQHVLEYLQAHRAVTIGELSQALKTTEANIRHHLSILQEQGLARVAGERPPAGRGRPAKLFGPSEQALGNNLDLLTDILLDELARGSNSDGSNGYLARVGGEMANRIAGQRGATEINRSRKPAIGAGENKRNTPQMTDRPPLAKTGGSLSQRLYETVRQLNQYHYQARWEAHRDAPRLILGHCPYSAVIEQHPELCQADAILLNALLHAEVHQLARLARDRQGILYCMFWVGKPDSGIRWQ